MSAYQWNSTFSEEVQCKRTEIFLIENDLGENPYNIWLEELMFLKMETV
jgi:hypothetical protein